MFLPDATKLSQLRFRPKRAQSNDRIILDYLPPPLQVVGLGTDAAILRWPGSMQPLYKVFHPQQIHKQQQEYQAYQRIQRHPRFGYCLAGQDNWLALRYEPGPTLYECLEKGIIIPQQILDDVAAARSYARSRGLNPRDVHLRNIIMQGGRAKLIDLSEYLQPGNDGRWEQLVAGYKQFYPALQGKPIPSWLIERVKNGYMAAPQAFSFQEIARKLRYFWPNG